MQTENKRFNLNDDAPMLHSNTSSTHIFSEYTNIFLFFLLLIIIHIAAITGLPILTDHSTNQLILKQQHFKIITLIGKFKLILVIFLLLMVNKKL